MITLLHFGSRVITFWGSTMVMNIKILLLPAEGWDVYKRSFRVLDFGLLFFIFFYFFEFFFFRFFSFFFSDFFFLITFCIIFLDIDSDRDFRVLDFGLWILKFEFCIWIFFIIIFYLFILGVLDISESLSEIFLYKYWGLASTCNLWLCLGLLIFFWLWTWSELDLGV